MMGRSEMEAALNAAFTLPIKPLSQTKPKSRNVKEALQRLDREATLLHEEIERTTMFDSISAFLGGKK